MGRQNRSTRSLALNAELGVLLLGLFFITMEIELGDALDTLGWLPDLMVTASLLVLAGLRPSPGKWDERWWIRPVVWASLFSFLLYEPPTEYLPAVHWVFLGLRMLAGISLAALGRSFSILPERRSVTTRGPYRIVRHPTYAIYTIADLLFVSVAPSVWNFFVLVFSSALLIVRIFLEERLLREDETYRSYSARVRWRALPGIW